MHFFSIGLFSFIFYCLPSYRPSVFAFQEKIKTIINRNESRSLVPSYFKIGQGNQWFRPVSPTCDFRISHGTARQTLLIALPPLCFPDIYSRSLLLCLSQASIIKRFSLLLGYQIFLPFLLGYETKITFYVGV